MIVAIASLLALASTCHAVKIEDTQAFSAAGGSARQHERRLSLEDGFEPLSCNDATPSCGSNSCKSWTSLFGTDDVYSSLVTVECGQCVTMDFDASDTLSFNRGIDIQGRLCFPDGYRLKLLSPMIVVQGFLEILSTKPVDGDPDVEFIMRGENEMSFTPHEENSDMCYGGDCEVGIKAITVAGGQVYFSGMPPDAPAWVNLHDLSDGTPNPSGIVVSDSVSGNWAPGAEILITTYSLDWLGHQVRKIVSVGNPVKGHVTLELDASISRPTTAVESPDFAVEIALLSRNIVFRANTPTAHIGGHFWVMHTPRVEQYIDGVEIIQFGQQGTLARYPMHFHLSGDVSGSVVSRNTIRQSLQRCIVAHASDNLLIEENVAFDTKGHCFMLEDGVETGNMFVRNLGAMIDEPDKLISGSETDNSPAIFWVTNPSNSFVGNVAAGSVDSGFWFETGKRGDYQDIVGEPEHMPLTLFRDNVVHSTRFGIRTYPFKAIRPDEGMARLQNLRVYRNRELALLLKGSHRISVEDSIVADGPLGIDIHMSNYVLIHNVTIVGMTDVYARQREEQPELPDVCNRRAIQGMELHLQGRNSELWGITIDDVSFDNFNVGCKRPSIINLDHINYEVFRNYVSFRNVEFDWRVPSPVDLCPRFDDYGLSVLLHWADLDGSLSPPSTPSTTAPGVILTSSETMLNFVDPSKCTDLPSACYTYCTDTCFRSVNYYVPASGTEDWSVAACSKDDPTDCVTFTWDDNGGEYHGYKRRFSVHLPAGEFVTYFLDPQGNMAWPSTVETKFQEVDLCPNTFSDSDVELLVPNPTVEDCSDLIQNGNMERSSTEATFWYFEGDRDIILAAGEGIGQSQAITTEETKKTSSLVQFLDVRCLVRNASYRVVAHFKLVDGRGNPYQCDPSEDDCPEVRYSIPGQSDVTIARVGNNDSMDSEGYQRLRNTLTVNNVLANAAEARLTIVSNTNDYRLYVDRVRMFAVETEDFVLTASPTVPPVPTLPPTLAPTAPTGRPTPQPIRSAPVNIDVQIHIRTGSFCYDGTVVIKPKNIYTGDLMAGVQVNLTVAEPAGPLFMTEVSDDSGRAKFTKFEVNPVEGEAQIEACAKTNDSDIYCNTDTITVFCD